MKLSILFLSLFLLILVSLSAPAGQINVPLDYPTIQAAVNAASSGDTVTVSAGTYREQVYINKNLTLSGAGSGSTFIVPPLASMSTPFAPARQERPLVGVDSLGTNVIIEGFTIDGEGLANGSTHARMTGIHYFKGSGIIRNNVVKRIRRTPLSGDQTLTGILVNHVFPNVYSHSVEIHNNTVEDWGKGGIVCNAPGAQVNIHDNTITGSGPLGSGLPAQNGIQIGFGATGSVVNNVVSNISYTVSTWAASGILGFASGGTLTIRGNTVTNTQSAINLQQDHGGVTWPAGTCNANVDSNIVSASATATGVTDLAGVVTWSVGGAAPDGASGREGVASPFEEEGSGGPAVPTEATMVVNFTGNTFTNTSAAPGGNGMYLIAAGTSPQTATLTGNTISGWEVGAVTDKDAGATLNSTWRRNSFTGNRYGMSDATGVLQDARENWWGHASGPRDVKTLPGTPNYNNTGGTGDSVTAFVDYNPWYLDAGLTTLSQYTLDVNIVGNGSVAKSPDQALYLHGSAVGLKATPATGWHFVAWSVDTTETSDTLSIAMYGNKNYTATFAINQYALSLATVGGGSISKNPDQALYDHGSSVELTGVADPSWVFSSWSGALTGATNPQNLVMDGPKSVTATFVWDNNVVSVDPAGDDGTGNGSPGAPFKTIQKGVNTVVGGGQVLVSAGTYREQVYINKNLTLSGAGSGSTFIVPPIASMSTPFAPARTERPLVGVDSLGTNVVIEGFTIDGEGLANGSTHARMTGIHYFKGSGIVRNNVVKRIRRTPLSGDQTLTGILVNHVFPNVYNHSVEMHNNTVEDWGKGGIVCNSPGLVVNIHDNTITGSGPLGAGLPAQNGIQVGFGATGTVAGNTVSAISYTVSTWSAAGILAYATDGTMQITGNTLTNNQVGVSLSQEFSGFYPSGQTNANVAHNIVTSSAAGVGTTSFYGVLTASNGGAILGPEGAVPSPFGLDEMEGKSAGGSLELATMTAGITGNTFTSSGNNGVGVYLYAYATSVQNVTGDSNSFTGHDKGVVLRKDAGATLTSTWRNNEFSGNTYGIFDLTGGAFAPGTTSHDARENWWGHVSGPAGPGNPGGQGDSVNTPDVEVNPWYLEPEMTSLSQYALNTTVVANGSVNRSPDDTLYLHGTEVILTAVPDPGFVFVGWSGDTTTTATSLTITMYEEKNYVATFTYGVTVSITGNGTVVRTPDQPTGYAPGSSLGVKALPDVGWHFVSWSGDTTATADSIHTIVHGNKNYTATFAINVYTVNIMVTGGGSVAKSPVQATYNHGDSVTLTATPNINRSFIGWGGDLSGSLNPLSFAITQNMNVFAMFTGGAFLTVQPESLLVKDHRGRVLRPVRRRAGSYPNWVNLLEEVVVQGGFQPGATESDVAGGMVIGVSHVLPHGPGTYRPDLDSARVMAWVRLTHWNAISQKGSRYNRVLGSLEDRTGTHTAEAHGLDVKLHPGPFLHFLLGEQTTIPPKRHNNVLVAEMIALKLNIAASQLGKTPAGFGSLSFNQPGNDLDGMTIEQISARVDSMMTYWRFRTREEWDSVYSALYRINRAFVAPLDTASWMVGKKLVLNGTVDITSVPYLYGSTAVPTLLAPTTDETESENEFDESEFINADGTPVAARLSTNYPNPFNPSTTISFKLRSPSMVTLRVFDMLGREVAVLLNDEEFDEGEEIAEFIADGLSSGVYFYQIDARDLESGTLRTVETRKMMLLK